MPIDFRHSVWQNCDNGQMQTLTIGQRIRLAREAAGFNQGELARRIGIKQASLSDLENGQSKAPSAKVLLDMADILKVSPRWIIEGEDGEVMVASPQEHSLLDLFRDLSDEQKAAVLGTLNALKKK